MRAESDLYKTDRWFEINPKAKDHPEQIRLTSDLMSGANRYFTIVAGRRSFKTERFAKRFPIVYALSHPDQIIHFGAPVRHQAKDIFWNDMLKLVHPNYIFSKSISELTITLHNKTQLQVIGLKEFARKEGTLCNLAVFSEFQHCDVEVFTQSYQPMLIDTNGIGIFEGRPHELNHLYDFYLRGKNGDKGWGSYHWESEGILTDDQIQQAKRDLTEVDYRREFKADFFTLGQRPYYAFDELSIKPFKINYELPFIITCDFNATEKPMSWVLGQRVQEKFQRGYLPVTYWIKTFAHQYTNTASMCEIVDEWIKTNLDYYPKQIFFYGDYAGVKKTSNSSFSDWDIITKYFNNKAKIDLRIKPTQSVRDSIAATNAQFKNALGERRQFVTSKDLHTTLIDDFYKCGWKSNGTELEDKDDMRGHASRSIDYFNDYETPIYGNEPAKVRD